MKKLGKLSIATLAVALGLASAALASGPGATHGSNAKAYGHLCQSESKQHVAGQPGTPFSKCVTDLAHLANNAKTNPHRACANESKKHVAGQKGTPYSQCVVAAAKLRSQGSQRGGSTTTTGS